MRFSKEITYTSKEEKSVGSHIITGEEHRKKSVELSHQQIGKIGKLNSQMWHVEKLYLSHNYIKRLDGIESLPQLQVLSLSNNLITEWEELRKVRNRGKLRFLGIHSNPLCYYPDYRRKLMNTFSNLEVLDDLKTTNYLRLAEERVYLSFSRKLLPFLMFVHADVHHAELEEIKRPQATETMVKDRLAFIHELGCRLR